MDTNNLKEKLESKRFNEVLISVGIAASVCIVFWAGVQVGYMKAGFSDRRFRSNEISGAHGVSGSIVSVDLPTFTVTDKDDTEKTVRLEDDTLIREFGGTVMPGDLKIGQYAVVIGSPDTKAEVEAHFIRILPPPPGTPQGQ